MDERVGFKVRGVHPVRIIIIEGTRYRISERDCNKIVKGLDTDKAFTNIFGYYTIQIDGICLSRWRTCVQCSLYNRYKKVNSCMHLFRSIVGEQFFRHLHFVDNAILWDPRFDREARQALQKIKGVFSTAMEI